MALNVLPEPPAGKRWFRKPYSTQYVLVSSDEYEKRMRKEEARYQLEFQSIKDEDRKLALAALKKN
jgi:hypothetical protein